MHLVIYTNILTPYRRYFFDLLEHECRKGQDEFHVLVMAETETGRSWKYQELKTNYTILLESKTITKGDANFHFNKNLSKVLRELKPTVLICAGGYNCPGVWKAVALKRKFNYQCLFWSETHLKEVKRNSCMKRYIREAARKMIYRRFDGFWYAGRLSKQFCETYAISNAKYFFLPNLIDEGVFAQKPSHEQRIEKRKRLGLKENSVVFICPARLVPVKGILEFIELIKDSRDKDKFIILIAGNGELKEKIKERAEKYKIDVRLVGEKKQSELIELYTAADIFLLPSLSDPNPLTCIEALWSSLPLFISEHCGNGPEVLRQGENGFVFSYREPDQAVEMFECLINSDPVWRESAGKVSYEIAENIYASKETAERIVREMKCQ